MRRHFSSIQSIDDERSQDLYFFFDGIEKGAYMPVLVKRAPSYADRCIKRADQLLFPLQGAGGQAARGEEMALSDNRRWRCDCRHADLGSIIASRERRLGSSHVSEKNSAPHDVSMN